MFGNLKYHLLLHAIILVWGFTGILGKLIELNSLQIVWWRVVIASSALGVYLLVRRKSFRIVDRKNAMAIALVGLLVGGHWVTFYMSIQLSTASLGILCLSTTTLHVTWLEPWIMKRRFLWSEFVFGCLVILALVYIAEDYDSSAYVAMGYGFLSAFLAAAFSVGNAKLVEKTPSTLLSFYELSIAIVLVSLLLLFNNQLDASLFEMTSSDLSWLLFLGLVCTSFAFLVVIDLVKRLGTFTVSLSINLEPVYTILLAIVILNENELLSTKFYIGSGLIVCVVIANTFVKSRINKKKKKTIHHP